MTYTNNPKLEAISHKVLIKSNIADDQEFGSVIAILMMISIILTVIRVLQECNKNKTNNMTASDKCALYGDNIRMYSSKKGWFTRRRIKKIIKQHMDSEDYSKYGLKITEALLSTGEDLTDDQVITLVEAANV